MPDFQITFIDIFIVIAYLAITIAIGIWLGSKGNDTAEGYFLGGRNFIWPLVGLSLFASNQSGASIVGLSGAGYDTGIAQGYNYEWTGAIALMFFLVFFLPFYLRSGVYTTPEYLERRYDRRSRYVFSVFLIFANVFIDLAAALYAGSLVIQVLYPSVQLWQAIAVLAIVAGVYTVLGGLAAVVITDAIQAVVLIIGSTIITFFVFGRIDSWEQVEAAAPDRAFSLIQPASDPVIPWPGLITGVMLLSIWYFCINQYVVQRTLGSKNLDHGRMGSLAGGALKLSLLFIIILPAVAANVLYPDLENPDAVWPTLAFDLLPIGFRGLVLAALVAAIMSSVDSILNSASTIITMDFVSTINPDAEQRTLVVAGRIATVVLLVVAMVWAPQISRFETLWTYLQAIVSFTVPPALAISLVGLFWKRSSPAGAFITLIIGLPIGIVGFFLTQVPSLQLFEIQFLYAATALTIFNVAVLVVASLATAAPSREQMERYTWSVELLREDSRELRGKPWYWNYRYWSVALLVVTAAIVIYYF
ncbi:MAG: sodium:solute symporter [Rubrobacteraceae bacterium]